MDRHFLRRSPHENMPMLWLCRHLHNQDLDMQHAAVLARMTRRLAAAARLSATARNGIQTGKSTH